MRDVLLAALAVVSALGGVAQASVPLPPNDPSANTRVISFAPPPETVTCASGTARRVEGAPLPPKTWRVWTPPPVAVPNHAPPKPPTSQVFTFSINAEGRVTDLKGGGVGLWSEEDQIAILASWRFAPGAPLSGCSLDAAPTAVPLAEAPPAKLFEIVAAEGRNAAPAVFQALNATDDCYKGVRRRPEIWAYPDLRPFDDKSVDPPWAVLTYDIDAKGATRNIKAALQHGDPALAKAAAAAIAKSRFLPGPARAGCRVVAKARPQLSAPPARPENGAFDRPEDKCDLTREQMNLSAPMAYPPAFARRRVGGWAIIRFDVAPWGEVGAVEVLAAQPTQAFGSPAQSLVRSARPKPSATGYHGCIVPIIYAIPPETDEDS
jgi:TonB family protein